MLIERHQPRMVMFAAVERMRSRSLLYSAAGNQHQGSEEGSPDVKHIGFLVM